MKRPFYSYWIASTSISLADVIYIMVITTFIYLKTNSALIASLFPLIKALARLIAGFTSPLLLEKFLFSRLLVSLQLIKAILITILILFFNPLSSQISVLLVFVVIISFIEGWGSPLINSVTPRIVPKESLIKANSSLSVTSQSVQIAGYTFTGFIVVKFGHMPTLIGAAILLWVASICIYLTSLSFNSKEPVKTAQSKWGIIKEGWSIIWKNRTIRLVTLMDMIEGIAGTIWVGAITLVYVKEALHQNELWWGYINSSYYFGTIIGGLFTLWFANKIQKHLILSMSMGSAFFSLFTLLYGLNSIPIIALILCVVMGPAYQLRDVAQQTALQTSVNLDILPKVYASRSILLSTITSISIALIGFVAEVFGIRWVYIFGSILIATSAVLSFSIIGIKKKQDASNISL